MRSVALLLIVALLAAGCAESGKNARTEETDFSDVDVKVSDTTGVLRGVVVDERIVPIVGVNLLAVGAAANKTTTSDDQGRFVIDDLPAGDYFIEATSALHKPARATGTVVAGEAEPDLIKMQLERLYQQEPFTSKLDHQGFFECSQAGASPFFSSSNCVSDFTRSSRVPGSPGLFPQLNDVTNQERQWQGAVEPGWQTLIWEIDWSPTSQGTSNNMGITVSTDFATRDTTFFYASHPSPAPLLLRLDLGVQHPTAQSTDDSNPPILPPEGRPDVSYFVSVRAPDGATCPLNVACAPPGLALNQDFHVYYTQFYYMPAPEGWSLVGGDEYPF